MLWSAKSGAGFPGSGDGIVWGSRVSPQARNARTGTPLAGIAHRCHLIPSPHLRDEPAAGPAPRPGRSEEHTSELQSHLKLVCRLLLEKKKKKKTKNRPKKKKKKKKKNKKKNKKK